MDKDSNIANNTILEALNLNAESPVAGKDEAEEVRCMFCDHSEKSDVKNENKSILQHLYLVHRLVISDVQDVSDLYEYLEFWKKEFKGLSKLLKQL